MDTKFSFTGLVSWKLLVAALVLALVSAMAIGLGARQSVQAAPGAGYILERGQVSAGGGISASGNYQASGGIGRPEAGSMAGGNYQMEGGIWHAPAAVFSIHLPLVVR